MSSTAGSAGGGDDAEQQKTSLFCKKCEEPIALRSAMLLDDGGLYGCSAEWQGVIWGLCLDCSGLSPEQFKRQAKKAWAARAVALGGRVKRYRTLTFENLSAMIQKELPGAKHSLIRELSFLRLKCCCLNLAAALDGENEFTLAARDHVQAKYTRGGSRQPPPTLQIVAPWMGRCIQRWSSPTSPRWPRASR